MTALTKARFNLGLANVAVGAARTLLHQRQVINLSGLETQAETLCGDIGSLPAERRRGHHA
jgi:hypothetical protein